MGQSGEGGRSSSGSGMGTKGELPAPPCRHCPSGSELVSQARQSMSWGSPRCPGRGRQGRGVLQCATSRGGAWCLSSNDRVIASSLLTLRAPLEGQE